MSKRKRETADEESASPEPHKKTKKQKTNTRTSKAAPKHAENETSAQSHVDSGKERQARRLDKRKRRALEKQRRNESKHKDEVKTVEDDGDTPGVGVGAKRLLEKGRTGSPKDQHESQGHGKKGGPKLREKHKSKKEERKEKTVQSSKKKSKENSVEVARWKISDPLGGQMLDVDPVFSPDEK